MFGSDANTLWFAAGAALAAVAVLAGFAFTRRRDSLAEPAPPAARGFSAAALDLGRRPAGVADAMCRSFLEWLAEHEDQAELWASFDQLVRELLTEHLGANRVRCYHVRAGAEALQPLSGGHGEMVGASSRHGVLGHVATSGKEFVAGDPGCGPLLDDLAARADEPWVWIWPVREAGAMLGLVAVGNLRQAGAPGVGLRRTVGQLLTIFWRHAACVERWRVVQRTDRGSGVLTRNDFFTLAAHALNDSYQTNEPVVAVVLALEGMRRLDDSGRWEERDRLIERLGCALARRVRSDDLVGRFADDRFVVLLRRLDSGLGRLIAEKMLAAGEECLEQMAGGRENLRLRLGLAGSGHGQPPLEKLLVTAFAAAERARRANVPIATDLLEAGGRGGAAAGESALEPQAKTEVSST
ncbi:MAG TPA: GGDEF domain-containing protein [Phycisphaerae bacterium]|jgi:GGDEF domain-containing protein|nr:GGDEF domain-containing protein [Phycisphaerae bacterium]